MHVTLLQPAHAPRYRKLMLEAYELAADAFTSTAAERAAEPEAFWAKRIADPKGLSVAFGAFDENDLLGTVALEFSTKPKTKHRALLIGMYVTPEARGKALGRALFEEAVRYAESKEGIASLPLTATEGNDAAINLYRSSGFEIFGTEPMAILTPSGYRAKVYMWLPLPRARAAA